MGDYLDYVRGGEILLAPSVNYKNAFVIRCGECDEHFTILESFIAHGFSHKNIRPETETPLSPAGLVDKVDVLKDVNTNDVLTPANKCSDAGEHVNTDVTSNDVSTTPYKCSNATEVTKHKDAVTQTLEKCPYISNGITTDDSINDSNHSCNSLKDVEPKTFVRPVDENRKHFKKKMADNFDYVRGGDILLAPSVNYKNTFIIRCGECDEHFIILETFIAHSFSHQELRPETKAPQSPAGLVDNICAYKDVNAEEDVNSNDVFTTATKCCNAAEVVNMDDNTNDVSTTANKCSNSTEVTIHKDADSQTLKKCSYISNEITTDDIIGDSKLSCDSLEDAEPISIIRPVDENCINDNRKHFNAIMYRRNPAKRIKWEEDEKEAIFKFFGPLKKLERLPTLALCTDAIRAFPVLANRTEPQIKTWIDNQRRCRKSMMDYKDYMKGGYILIAPSLDYKDIYVVKCSKCGEHYTILESFITHIFSHYGLSPKEEATSPADLLEEIYEDVDVDAEKRYDFNVASDYEVPTTTGECDPDSEEVDPLTSLKRDTCVDHKFVVKKETIVDDETQDTSYNDEPADSEEISGSQSCANSDNDNESDDESLGGQDNQTRIYIRNFLKSKENTTALIEAYKNIPHLWNLNYPTQLRRKDERVKSLQQIAAELESTIKLQIAYNQVSAIIIHLRYKYRERIKFEKSNVKPRATKKNGLLPLWIFEQLSFLKPFVEFNPIGILECCQQDLVPEQIIQLLTLYERFPHLWNTNLMEHYCFNKRSEALKQMANLIELEMSLEVDENSLKKYLHCVHVQFSREKQRCELSNIKTNEEKSQYFEHMEFLYEHVGLFRCSQCKRKFKGPIHLKEHQATHDGTMPFSCSLCKHEFKTASAYVSHVRRHMGDLGEECQECGKKFLKAVDLRIHMRSHTGDKPFCCELCGTSYRQQQAFLAHKRKHEQKFVLFCPVCSKGFYTKNKMKVHIATHYDVRNYVCGTCGKAFKTRNTLQKHEYTHEEGRNHECTLCGKMFKNKINLAHHRRTHGRNIADLIAK